MSTFSNKRNKLKFVSTFNQEITNNLKLQETVNQIVKSKINNNSTQYIFKKLTNLNSEWETLDEFIYLKNGNPSSRDYYYKNWTVIFPSLPIYFIPNIDIKILIRLGKGTLLPPNSNSYWNTLSDFKHSPVIIQVEDIEGNENLKKITYGIGGFMDKNDYDVITQYWGMIEVKLILQFYNSKTYA